MYNHGWHAPHAVMFFHWSTAPPLFGPRLLWPNGRPSQLLLSTCYVVVYFQPCTIWSFTFSSCQNCANFVFAIALAIQFYTDFSNSDQIWFAHTPVEKLPTTQGTLTASMLHLIEENWHYKNIANTNEISYITSYLYTVVHKNVAVHFWS